MAVQALDINTPGCRIRWLGLVELLPLALNRSVTHAWLVNYANSYTLHLELS